MNELVALNEKCMTMTEAAALLQVTPPRVWALLKAGRIVDAGHVGRAHLVTRSSVEELAAERAHNPPRGGRPRKEAA